MIAYLNYSNINLSREWMIWEMSRNYKDEYNHSRREALEMAKRYGTSNGIELYLPFTKYGKKVFQNMNRKLYEDAENILNDFCGTEK